jgi:hypothetical protein
MRSQWRSADREFRETAASIGNLYTLNTLTGEASLAGQMGEGDQHYALAIVSGRLVSRRGPWLSLGLLRAAYLVSITAP